MNKFLTTIGVTLVSSLVVMVASCKAIPHEYEMSLPDEIVYIYNARAFFDGGSVKFNVKGKNDRCYEVWYNKRSYDDPRLNRYRTIYVRELDAYDREFVKLDVGGREERSMLKMLKDCLDRSVVAAEDSEWVSFMLLDISKRKGVTH
jgi:hypothetical protein